MGWTELKWVWGRHCRRRRQRQCRWVCEWMIIIIWRHVEQCWNMTTFRGIGTALLSIVISQSTNPLIWNCRNICRRVCVCVSVVCDSLHYVPSYHKHLVIKTADVQITIYTNAFSIESLRTKESEKNEWKFIDVRHFSAWYMTLAHGNSFLSSFFLWFFPLFVRLDLHSKSSDCWCHFRNVPSNPNCICIRAEKWW